MKIQISSLDLNLTILPNLVGLLFSVHFEIVNLPYFHVTSINPSVHLLFFASSSSSPYCDQYIQYYYYHLHSHHCREHHHHHYHNNIIIIIIKTWKYTHTYTHTHTYTRACVRVHTHIHACAYIHAHTHARIHPYRTFARSIKCSAVTEYRSDNNIITVCDGHGIDNKHLALNIYRCAILPGVNMVSSIAASILNWNFVRKLYK